MRLFKPKKLSNTKIPSLYVVPIKHIYLKYLVIVLLLISTTALVIRLYDTVSSPHICAASISSPKVSDSEDEVTPLAIKVSSLYHIAFSDAKQIVSTALIYSRPTTFPTVYDTLAIIATESHFNQYAVSSTGAKGLMQVLYKATSFDIERNINDGVSLLQEYKDKVGSEDAAVQSYNVGIGAYIAGSRNQDYLTKFKAERKKLKQ